MNTIQIHLSILARACLSVTLVMQLSACASYPRSEPSSTAHLATSVKACTVPSVVTEPAQVAPKDAKVECGPLVPSEYVRVLGTNIYVPASSKLAQESKKFWQTELNKAGDEKQVHAAKPESKAVEVSNAYVQ